MGRFLLDESRATLFVSALRLVGEGPLEAGRSSCRHSKGLSFVFFFGAPFCLICANAFPCFFFFHSSELSLKVVFVFLQCAQLDFQILAVGSAALVCLLVTEVSPLFCFLCNLKLGKGVFVFIGFIPPVVSVFL